jgi:hypothetical protein
VICSFFPFSPVSTLGFEPRTLSANDKRAKPLDHAAAPRRADLRGGKLSLKIV